MGLPAEAARRCSFFFLHSSHSPPLAVVPPQAHLRCRTSAALPTSGDAALGVFGFSTTGVRSLIFVLLLYF
jgi:hypothetical protein